MRILGLDVGNRRTGIAFLDDATGVPLPLPTLTHASEAELLEKVRAIIEARGVDRVVVGLPLLLSGEEGEQTKRSRAIGEALSSAGIAVTYIDERYTTPGGSPGKHAPPASSYDGDAAAACELLRGKIDY